MWNQLITEYEKCQLDLKQAFKENEKLTKVKRKASVQQGLHLTKFKYMAGCGFGRPASRASRGTTFIGSGEDVIYSANKSFNLGDELAKKTGITLDMLWDGFQQEEFEMFVSLKLDGTNIQITYLPSSSEEKSKEGEEEGRFLITTLGSVDENCIVKGYTYSQCIKDVLGEEVMHVIKNHPEYSFVFELCTKHNQIVTKYDKDFAELIYLISRRSGFLEENEEVQQEFTNAGGKVVKRWELKREEDKNQIFDILNSLTETKEYGENPEGLCLFIHKSTMEGLKATRVQQIPMAKIKRKDYLSKATNGASELVEGTMEAKNAAENAVISGNGDDMNIEREHMEKFEQSLNRMEELVEKWMSAQYDRKNLSAKMREEKVPSCVQCYLFQFYQKEQNVNFRKWLNSKPKSGKPKIVQFQKYSKLDKFWFEY